jgi:integrase
MTTNRTRDAERRGYAGQGDSSESWPASARRWDCCWAGQRASRSAQPSARPRGAGRRRAQHGHRAAPSSQAAAPRPSASAFVDPASGVPFRNGRPRRHFDRLITGHGLPRIRLHDLRHTSASIGLASGESLLEVSRRLGHSSISITADIYSHISPVVARESAERLAQQVFGND